MVNRDADQNGVEAPGTDARLGLAVLDAGTARIGSDGHLIRADDLFLSLHGLDAERVDATGHQLDELMQSDDCMLDREDVAALEAGWRKLLKDLAGGESRRDKLNLADGRTLELGLLRNDDQTIVLVARSAAPDSILLEVRTPRRTLIHDVNNALGSVLANLYLASSDLEPGHPAAGWLESINETIMDLRRRIQDESKRSAEAVSGKPEE